MDIPESLKASFESVSLSTLNACLSHCIKLEQEQRSFPDPKILCQVKWLHLIQSVSTKHLQPSNSSDQSNRSAQIPTSTPIPSTPIPSTPIASTPPVTTSVHAKKAATWPVDAPASVDAAPTKQPAKAATWPVDAPASVDAAPTKQPAKAATWPVDTPASVNTAATSQPDTTLAGTKPLKVAINATNETTGSRAIESHGSGAAINWNNIKSAVKSQRANLYIIIKDTTLVDVSNNTVSIDLKSPVKFFKQKLTEKSVVEFLETLITDQTGHKYKVRVLDDEVATSSTANATTEAPAPATSLGNQPSVQQQNMSSVQDSVSKPSGLESSTQQHSVNKTVPAQKPKDSVKTMNLNQVVAMFQGTVVQ